MSVIERMLGRDHGGSSEPSGLVLAPMRKRDLKDGVLATEARAYPTPWSPSVFQSEIEQVRSGSRFYITARRRSDRGRAVGRSIGHAGLWFTADEAHVTNVAVHPDARREGIGTALMVALADEAIARGCEAWTLEVRVSSTGAQELYRRFGFAPAGVRRRYYDNVEDAIVMWCHDVQTEEYRRLLDDMRAQR